MNFQTFDTSDLEALKQLADWFVTHVKPGQWIHLEGGLGVGKTTFSQQLIKAMGCETAVTSPTYALMNSYQTPKGEILHCDLYRLSDPEELYEVGLLDMAAESNAVVLVEWPSKGQGVLPSPNYTIKFDLSVVSGEVERTAKVIEHKVAATL